MFVQLGTVSYFTPSWFRKPEEMTKLARLDLGITACGDVYTSDDFVVALSQSTFGWSYPSKYCNREVIVSYGGKTANAKLVDSVSTACEHSSAGMNIDDPPSNNSVWRVRAMALGVLVCCNSPFLSRSQNYCSRPSILIETSHARVDLSVGLFKHFADVGLGVINVDWSFADGSGGDDGGDDAPVKHTTSTHHTTSTRHTTSTHHTTTTHTTPTTTSHHTTSTTPKTTSTTTRAKPSTTSHSTTSTSSTTSSALPSTTSSSSNPSASGNILNVNDVILNLEAILQAAAAN